MPRRRRTLIEGGLYHVYNRFARGEEVFADHEEAVEFVERLRAVKRRDGLTVFAWALLSNHYHLAGRTSAVPLSRTLGYLQGRYARSFNRRRDSQTARLRELVVAVGVERWGQRAGLLGSLLDKHPVSVSRWVGEAGRRRNEDAGFAQGMDQLDGRLSEWAMEAKEQGRLSSFLHMHTEKTQHC